MHRNSEEELDRKKKTIVEAFAERERVQSSPNWDKCDEEETTDLIGEHNKTVELQDNPNPSHSSIFPTEIILECFRFAANATPNLVLELVFISRSWSELILSSPYLWTNILIDNTSSDHSLMLHTMLHLSKDLPVSITLRFSDLVNPVHIDPLIPHKDRIYKLSLQTLYFLELNQEDPSPWIEARDKVLSRLGTLENLKILERGIFGGHGLKKIETQDLFPEDLGAEYPKLERLIGLNLSFQLFKSLNRPNFKELELLSTFGTFTEEYDSRMPELEHLRFNKTADVESFRIFSESKDKETFVMPKLISLDCSVLRFRGDIPLLSAYTLRHISLTLTWLSLGQYLKSFLSLPSLHTLRLTIAKRLEPDNIFNGSQPLPDIAKVKVFEMILRPIGTPEDKIRRLHHSSFERFSSLWGVLMPQVEKFIFRPTDNLSMDHLSTYLRSLRRITYIEILVGPRSLIRFPANSIGWLPSLLSIQTDHPQFLEAIEAPNLTHIVAYGDPAMRITTPLTSLALTSITLTTHLADLISLESPLLITQLYWEEPHWEVVRTIPRVNFNQFIPAPLAPPKSILPNTLALRKLNILSFGNNIDLDDQHEILITLMKDPEILPFLEIISFAQYPSMSLLLRALFRRNVARHPEASTKSIKEIKLPAIPSQNILLRLTSILHPKIAPAKVREQGLPEEDISVYDLDLPGCLTCFVSGRKCAVEEDNSTTFWATHYRTRGGANSRAAYARKHDIRWNALVEGFDCTKVIDEAWCETWRRVWKERRILIERVCRKRRFKACSLYDPYNTVRITGLYECASSDNNVV